ncbi:MAG: hypothetical protein KJO40_10965 [Deltaproteobacteria bacterium]|nr:hypothetical protein [Deltaproteobacteria bacterium]NND28243.1 hypothetical protein [Myxococcales bacterium]MBT8466265.1 hypothetical protein [Deltaproteobacteria bacterium]NNK07133.1 hypothetical protein [Myxococcales bacterium]NNK42382.1 hypothetical protein [Myxococcales bacterium]
MARAARNPGLAAWVWVPIAALAVFELVAHSTIEAAIPSDASWEAAAAFVRARHRPADRIAGAPAWVDPIVRQRLGDLLSLRMAAPPDSAGIDRLWELSIRGARSRDEPPALEQEFDGVHVRMWTLLGDELVYDFAEEIAGAKVELVGADRSEVCPLMAARQMPGGLERGPMTPRERFVCDPRRPWLWVGATVLSDLDLEPRRCIWQHPAGRDPVRVTFTEVPLGDRLLVHGGIDYQIERRRNHGPVTLRVWINERIAAELLHEDGDGWASLEIDTSELLGQTATVRFETTADDPTARLFCWSASSVRNRGSSRGRDE